MYPMMCIMGDFADSGANGACTACPVDKYCDFHATTIAKQKTCPNGYNCVTKTPVERPNWTPSEMTNYHLCDLGHFCDGSNNPRQ